MSARYSIMNGQASFAMQKFNDSLPGRILSVLFATLAASGLTYLVFLANRGIVPIVLQWVLVCALGVIAGFAARALLNSRTFLLRLLTALLALLSGLILLGLVSRGALGARLPSSSQDGLNLGWLGQFGLAGAAAWFSLSAWKIPPQSLDKSRSAKRSPLRGSGPKKTRPETSRSASHQAKRSKRAPDSPEAALPPVVQPEFWSDQWKRLRVRLRGWWEHGLPDLPSAPPLRRAKKPVVRLQNRRRPRHVPSNSFAANPSVRLIGKEEHRCPYCLEEVLENDPRGVKICPICHTYHHADCWAVTGTCQVPHYHD